MLGKGSIVGGYNSLHLKAFFLDNNTCCICSIWDNPYPRITLICGSQELFLHVETSYCLILWYTNVFWVFSVKGDIFLQLGKIFHYILNYCSFLLIIFFLFLKHQLLLCQMYWIYSLNLYIFLILSFLCHFILFWVIPCPQSSRLRSQNPRVVTLSSKLISL